MFGLTLAELQLFLIRVYLGPDFIPHFSEKLLEGSGPRGEDIASFKAMGLSNPEFMVILAGLCELGAFIGLTFGLTGGGRWSLDALIRDRAGLPGWLRRLAA